MTNTTKPATKVVTLKSGATITLYWCKSLDCYVSIPE
jgi:hypothetical protein